MFPEVKGYSLIKTEQFDSFSEELKAELTKLISSPFNKNTTIRAIMFIANRWHSKISNDSSEFEELRFEIQEKQGGVNIILLNLFTLLFFSDDYVPFCCLQGSNTYSTNRNTYQYISSTNYGILN